MEKAKILGKYRLLKDLPDLKSGVVFEHRSYSNNHPDRGNPGCGVMILGWVNGNSQDTWCADTYILPGQLSKNKEWFKRIDASIEEELAELKSRIETLEESLK
jgi:hypothetical protein